MVKSKLIQITPFMTNFKLSKDMGPQNDVDLKGMLSTLFQNAIGSLMYAMVCKRLDIAHAMGVVNQFMANFG
jgi:ATP-binding cassette subfamily B (MDR/TAP) protein 1